MITSENYSHHAVRTERIPEGDTPLSDPEAQTLALALKAAIDVGAQIDRLKRHIYYGQKHDMEDIAMSLPDGSTVVKPELKLTPKQYRLLHSALGLLTEAAEYAETVNQHIMEGTPLDEVNLKAEGGDTCWYLAIPVNVFGWTFDQMLEANIAKLRKRYPDKWSQDCAVNRNLDAERQAVAQAAPAEAAK